MLAALLALLTTFAPPGRPAAASPMVGGSAPSHETRTEIPPRPRWVRHVVRPRERLRQIAVRYGVSTGELVKWNKALDERDPVVRKGMKLRVRARRIPPPRYRVEHVLREGETLGTLAVRYRVEYRDLLAYNWQLREQTPGKSVVVWVDPDFPPRTVNVRPGPDIPESFEIPKGGRSRGRPHKGRLDDGIQLPDLPYYTVREPAIAWVSSHAAEVLVRALADFRHRTGYDGEIVIGSISRRRGGRFPPHVSHQSGRDVDIRLPLLPGVRSHREPHPDEIDWSATWEMVRSFVDSGEVVAIYLDVPLQRRLFQAALWEGMTPEELDGVIQWPSRTGHEGAIVRHEPGHDGHIHVRIRCGPDEPRCKGRRGRGRPTSGATKDGTIEQ